MSTREAEKTIVRLAKGNPGAVVVLTQVYQVMGEGEFSAVVQGLRVMGLSGPEIWFCYEQYADRDLQLFVDEVRERSERMQAEVDRDRARRR
jgi:succinylarginine dihydrolase